VDSPDRTHRLQEVADYRTVRKTLRASSIGSLIFGTLALAGGLMPPADPVLAAVGLLLLGTGIWNLTAPRPAGILIDGAALVVVGLYNVISTFAAAAQGHAGAGAGFFAKVGVFQIIWGVMSFWRFLRFRDAFRSVPSDVELRQLEGLAEVLRRGKVKESLDLIEFTTSGLSARRWKARLEPAMVVMATDGGREVLVADRATFDIEDRGKVLIGSARKAAFVVRGRRLTGVIPEESMARFQQWKTGVVIPKALAA